jgi:hypothetical protein
MNWNLFGWSAYTLLLGWIIFQVGYLKGRIDANLENMNRTLDRLIDQPSYRSKGESPE